MILTTKLVIGETLTWVSFQMGGDLRHEIHAELLKLPLTYAVDAIELRSVNRIVMGHLAQGYVEVVLPNVRVPKHNSLGAFANSHWY